MMILFNIRPIKYVSRQHYWSIRDARTALVALPVQELRPQQERRHLKVLGSENIRDAFVHGQSRLSFAGSVVCQAHTAAGASATPV